MCRPFGIFRESLSRFIGRDRGSLFYLFGEQNKVPLIYPLCSIHTWGQNLSFHPHLHCIVSGGGIKNKKWVSAKRGNQKFLFPVHALKKVYKYKAIIRRWPVFITVIFPSKLESALSY